MAVIKVQNLSKKYAIYDRPLDKLRELLHLCRGPLHSEFWALRDISFEVNPGETLGIIGQNGSGKSTLLQLLAGIMKQTRGDCWVSGRISALLELGSGFNPEFTGRENVFMNAAILGLDSGQVQERFDAIAEFAEIGDFIHQPVKTYSSGMFMRLAFAVAVNVDPDVLLVDEALAVGDLIFQHRCMHRMNQLRDSGKTTIFVTHDLGAVAKFCDRALLLDRGRLLEDGKPDFVVQKYRALIFERERSYDRTLGESRPDGEEILDKMVTASISEMPLAESIPNIDHRFGNGDATIVGIELMDGNGSPTREVVGGQKVTVRITAQFNRDNSVPIIGYTLRDRLGVEISAGNTSHAEHVLPAVRKGQKITSDFRVALPHLAPGSYSLSPAVAKGNLIKHDMCDWIDNALVFDLQTEHVIYGMLKMDVAVTNYIGANPDSSHRTTP
jgi:ABC-type polysaccharide/polyol phosphate transport system ATPase subunit